MSQNLQQLDQVNILSRLRRAYQEPSYMVEGIDAPVPLGDLIEYMLNIVNNINNDGTMPLATEGIQKTFMGLRDTNVSLPSGGYYIVVTHNDPSGGAITVNGESLAFGDRYSTEVQYDRTENKQDFAEAVNIESDGVEYALRVSYPSVHPFNPNTL